MRMRMNIANIEYIGEPAIYDGSPQGGLTPCSDGDRYQDLLEMPSPCLI